MSRSASPPPYEGPVVTTPTRDGSVLTLETPSGHDADDTDDAQEQCPPAYSSYDQPLPQFYQPYYSTALTHAYASSSTQYYCCPSHPPVPPDGRYQPPSMHQPSGLANYNRSEQQPIPGPYGYGHEYDYIHARHTQQQYGQEYRPLFSHHSQQPMFSDPCNHYRPCSFGPSGWHTCSSDNMSPAGDTFSSSQSNSQSNSTKGFSLSIKSAYNKFKTSLGTAVQALKFKNRSDDCEILEQCACFNNGREEGCEDYQRPYTTDAQDILHTNANPNLEEEEADDDGEEASLYPESRTRVRRKETCECKPCMKASIDRIIRRSRGGRRKYRRVISIQRRITSFKLSRLNALN